MQKKKKSFGQEGQLNTSSPHPKRQNHQIYINKRQPLKDKQSAQQFMHSFLNLNHLLPYTLAQPKTSVQKNEMEFILANHLSGYYVGKKCMQGRPKYRNNNGNTKYQIIQTNNKTQQTFIDEESEYQNYLKQYQTVIKNSRSKQFVSPMAHKKEIDELITQFLSDINQSDVKSTQISPRINKMPTNKTEKPEKYQRPRSPQVVKIQKIDLTNLKANSYQSLHNKSNRKDTVKEQRQIIKRKQNEKIYNEKPKFVKMQGLSPHFSEKKKDINQQQNYQTIHKMTRQKSSEKLKIQAIKVQDLRSKNNIPQKKQKKITQYSQNIINVAQKSQKVIPESNSYLQQNFYKISKTQLIKQTNQKAKIQQTSQVQKKTQENKAKKPLKIQIQISEEFDDQQLIVELDSSLQKQKTEIIRMVSKKVTNMIQDTQKIALNKAK